MRPLSQAPTRPQCLKDGRLRPQTASFRPYSHLVAASVAPNLICSALSHGARACTLLITKTNALRAQTLSYSPPPPLQPSCCLWSTPSQQPRLSRCYILSAVDATDDGVGCAQGMMNSGPRWPPVLSGCFHSPFRRPSAFPRTSSPSGTNSIQLGVSWSVLVCVLFWASPAVVAAADALLVSISTKGRSVGADGAPLLIWRRSNSLASTPAPAWPWRVALLAVAQRSPLIPYP
ncbi:hypothetical protein C8Q70DRAFT_101312 [Cubamyces menziesii]|nr:hypothetical protein C8Q70DRAFT_101312 [Cubamyces menziesii]